MPLQSERQIIKPLILKGPLMYSYRFHIRVDDGSHFQTPTNIDFHNFLDVQMSQLSFKTCCFVPSYLTSFFDLLCSRRPQQNPKRTSDTNTHILKESQHNHKAILKKLFQPSIYIIFIYILLYIYIIHSYSFFYT